MKQGTIFIVEDNAVIADLIKWRLTEMGYQVIGCVPTAEEAIEKIEKEMPDLVLMDIDLPGEMDGIEGAKEISRRFGIPFVFLTSLFDDSIMERAKATGPKGYIVKPFSDNQLRASVEMALKGENGA